MMRKKNLKASMGIVCLQVCRHNYLKSCFNLVQIGLQIILISKFTVRNLLGIQRDSVETISHPDHLPQPFQDIFVFIISAPEDALTLRRQSAPSASLWRHNS